MANVGTLFTFPSHVRALNYQASTWSQNTRMLKLPNTHILRRSNIYDFYIDLALNTHGLLFVKGDQVTSIWPNVISLCGIL
jgi:hypothetical protein